MALPPGVNAEPPSEGICCAPRDHGHLLRRGNALAERLSGRQPAERHIRDQRVELARRRGSGGRRTCTGPARPRRHGQGHDRDRRGRQHRGAGHAGPPPAQAGPPPAESELGIHPRGGRLTVGYLVKQRTNLRLSHDRSLLVDGVLATSAADWLTGIGVMPRPERAAHRLQGPGRLALHRPRRATQNLSAPVNIQVAVKAQHQGGALAGGQRRDRCPQVEHDIVVHHGRRRVAHRCRPDVPASPTGSAAPR